MVSISPENALSVCGVKDVDDVDTGPQSLTIQSAILEPPLPLRLVQTLKGIRPYISNGKTLSFYILVDPGLSKGGGHGYLSKRNNYIAN